MTSWWLVCEKI